MQKSYEKRQAIRHRREGEYEFHDLRHTAKTIARKAGVDKNVRMVMFGNCGNIDMCFGYDTVAGTFCRGKMQMFP